MALEESETSGSKTVNFHVSLSTDRDGFLRRTCEACGRDFKTEIDPADLQWALSAQCQRMGLEVGGEPESANVIAETLRCPFCEHEAAGTEMHTPETVEYLRRIVYREYMLPQINKAFSGLEDTLGSQRSSGGFLSISLSFSHDRSLLPVRPMHGPEPADMKIVWFQCCGKRIKVPEGWSAIDVCSYCKAPVVLI